MRFLLLPLFVLFLSCVIAQAQRATAMRLRQNVVAIHTEFANGFAEDGFGFVTGERDGLLFIATAAHVVEQVGAQATIKLRFRADYREYPATLIRSNSEWDIALLECEKPRAYQWNPDYKGEMVQNGAAVSYVGRNQQWYIPTTKTDGLVNTVRDDRILVDVIGLSRGTSGAPLISRAGIVGLIIDAEQAVAQAVTMDRLERVLTNYGEFSYFFGGDNNVPLSTTPTPEMVTVPGGTFTMGCASEARDGDCEDDEKPAHEVTVDAFYMSVHEVTVGQFMAFIEDSGYRTDTDKEGWSYIWTGSSYEKKDGVNWKCDVSGDIRPQVEYRHPVIHVSWNDAVAYAEWLSQKTGQNYRLPTEAEWEYAARGGERGAKDNHLYSGSNTIDEVAWYDGNSGGQTHPVGQKKANQLGLYDMSGNVWEWCADWYGEYPAAAQRNPTGPGRGSDRVLRGGGWISSPQYCRAANRDNGNPDARSGYVGFRVVSSQ